MNKLLNKPLKAFGIYALLVLLLSIPAYYLVVDYIWLSELDENNQITRDRIANRLGESNFTGAELDTVLMALNDIHPGATITPVLLGEVKDDSVYTVFKPNKYTVDNEINRFRTRSSYININGKNYRLVVETNVEEADETVVAIAFVTFIFFVVLVTGFILLNRRIALAIWQPFNQTLQKLKYFDLQKQQTPEFPKTDIEEFEELHKTLNHLIENNITAYNQQKEFTENASHELQTPLALLKAKLDLLQQDKQLTESQAEHINALNIPLARISRINKNLLLLAKIENNQYAEQEEINLTELLHENLEMFSEHFAEKKLVLDQHLMADVCIKGNKDLTEILLTNLLINTVRHSPANGLVQIRLTSSLLEVCNTGSYALDADKLFKRFKTSSSASPNTGLGLAIIKEICHRYGWYISYSFQNNMHIFSWKFR